MESEEVRDIFVIPIRQKDDSYEIFLTKKDTDVKDRWVDLRDVKEWSKDNDHSRMYNYFLAFLSLASSLCYDRNYKGINAFVNIFTVEIVFGCAKMEELPYEMRSRFTDLLLSLHVDKQPLEPLRVPALTRIWDVFEDGDDDMPVKEKVPETLNNLKDFVKKYLIDSKGQQKSYERDKNKMTLSVLNLARSLIIFGFYRTEDELIKVVDPLITLLDGSHDVTNESEEEIIRLHNEQEIIANDTNSHDELVKPGFIRFTTRYEMTEYNLTVMNCKNKMCEILGIVMSIQNDIRVTRFLREFNNRTINEVYSQSASAMKQKNVLKKIGVSNELKGNTMARKLNDLFEKLLDDRKLDLEELSWADYVCINLDLILYKDEGLLNRAFSLLIRFHSQRRSLFDLLRSVQMLESDQAIDTLRQIEQLLTELRRMAQNSEFWLGQNDRQSVITAKKTVDIFNYLSSLLITNLSEDHVDEEIKMMKIAHSNPFLTVGDKQNRKGGSQNPETSSFVKKSTDQDLVSFVNDNIDLERPLPLESEQPNPEYQRMLKNLEAHEIVLSIIKQNSLKNVEDIKLYQKVLKSGYSMLIRFVRRNKANQKVLYGYVDTVFKDHNGTGLGATQLVGEILRDDPSLLQKGYSNFKDKVDIIEDTDIGSFLKATQMHYMAVFMQYRDEPIVDNQNAVITELTQKTNKHTIHLFNSEDDRDELPLIVNDL